MTEKRWDARPRYVYFQGRNVEVFTRGDLARALNRQLVTIRLMEQHGVLRHPKLRNKRGFWCYTRDQIEDLVRLAAEEGVLDPRFRRPFSKRFITDAHQILQRLP